MEGYICVDIGGTNIRTALFGKKNIRPLEFIETKTQAETETAEERLIKQIENIWPKKGEIRAIGVAAAGYVDSSHGIVLLAVNIPGWQNLPLRKIIRKKFKTPVYIENDARLAALGEWRHGAAKGHHDVIYLTISTGIGGGVIIKDRLLQGSNGIATEIGHTTILPDGPICFCGHKGHLEALSSGNAITKYVQEQITNGIQSPITKEVEINSKIIYDYAKMGDELSKKAFEQAGYYLGIGIANLIHIFNPTCIVLGGGVSHSGDLLLRPMRTSLEQQLLGKEYLKELSIKISILGDLAGLVGALTFIQTFDS